MSLPDCEILREYDGDGEYGAPSAVIIDGHVEDDIAVPLYEYTIAEEWGEDYAGSCQAPRRRWVRKVPQRDGGWIAHFTDRPGRGARAVTVVDVQGGWRHSCDLRGCENHYVRGSARTGFPIEQTIDPPEPRQDPKYVYLCRRHAESFDERRKAARLEALTKLRQAQATTEEG